MLSLSATSSQIRLMSYFSSSICACPDPPFTRFLLVLTHTVQLNTSRPAPCQIYLFLSRFSFEAKVYIRAYDRLESKAASSSHAIRKQSTLTVLASSSGGLSLMSVTVMRAVAVLERPKFRLPSMSVACTISVY